jgi:hypothetical protein
MSMYDLDPLTGRSTTCSPASWLAEIGLVLVLERHNADCVRLPQWYSCGNENKKKVVAKLQSTTKVVAKYKSSSQVQHTQYKSTARSRMLHLDMRIKEPNQHFSLMILQWFMQQDNNIVNFCVVNQDEEVLGSHLYYTIGQFLTKLQREATLRV